MAPSQDKKSQSKAALGVTQLVGVVISLVPARTGSARVDNKDITEVKYGRGVVASSIMPLNPIPK